MVALVKHDLEFILKQIEIAEAHAAGGDLAELVAGYNGNDGLAQAHLLPYGLRTVDGSYNNLLPGRENWGASDQSFPGIFTPNYLNDADGDRYDFNPMPNVETWYTNNNYANAGTGSGSSPGPGSGTVIDADPRIISNLIVDQTLNNPAAIAAALTHAGMSGQALMAALSDIVNANTALKAIPAPAVGGTASEAYTAAKTVLDAKLAQYGVEMDGNTVYLPNVSPDEGLSSPFNGWMTIFGQFFDHGLDLVAKGGNGTVYVPLSPDDPLYVVGGQNYIPLTRVTVNPGADNILGTADDGAGPKNLTTPWVDQNQTYASTASKQVFMREYVPGSDGKPIATGYLLEGENGGLATWADIKEQAREVLGIILTDADVGNIPLIASDEYGNFIRGGSGYPQLVVGRGEDGLLGTADDVLREGNPAAPVTTQGVVLTGHAFLDDIAHAAAPVFLNTGTPTAPVLVLNPDEDSALGYANADGSPGPQGLRGPSAYDNELLDRHFIAGDGRVNENIALTAVHQVFHAEHNRIVEHTKEVTLESMDRDFINEWLLTDLTDGQFEALTNGGAEAIADLSETLDWNGERLFQVGRFTNEMEYQHLVFEEFGRMMQPDIDAFVFEPSADINPSIAAEFAHVVYRFGHSMLREDIAVIELDANGNPVQNDIALFHGFLNPVMYESLGSAEEASGAIIRGMSRQAGSEIDEFVTNVLRNQLLGVPLDLAAINLARGRDVGTPPLNAARDKFFEETGDTLLKPYESWADFALNLKNPASIINFIAAYGTHETLTNTQANPKTVEELREAATKLVLGDSTLTGPAKTNFDNDRLDFLNAEGDYAGGTLGGLNTVDFWIGGLAEKKMAFGGMLGSTFAFVFQMTMENLQDADRFYYLSRTQGLNLLNELENNTFAELVMRNTDLGNPDSTALPGNLFSAFDMPQLEMDISKQLDPDPVSDDPFLGGFSTLIERVDADEDGVAEYLRVNSNEHFVIGGTEGNDAIVSGGGDDAIWGKGGDDTIEAGYGVDKVFGGDGDDIITNAGTDIGEADFLHGNEGNDVIHGGSGLSLLFGNQGNDFIIAGPDGKEAFGGTGDDFILGGSGGDFLLGNEGDDWIEGGQRFDTLAGENSELFFNSTIIGHDVLNGGSGDTDYDSESGDDIMFQNDEGIQRSNGMAGFDWAIHKGDSHAADSNLGIPIFETQEAFILRDRFDLVEGLSGWKHDDVLTGRKTAVNTRAEIEGTAAIPGPDSPLDSYSNDLLAKNVGLISGLAPLVAHLGAGIPVTRVVNGVTVPVLDENGVQERVIFSTADASDILLGGGGSDIIKGLAGDDIIDGDNWLNVRIRFVEAGVAYTVDEMKGLVYREADYVNGAPKADAVAQFGGRSLDELMFDRTVNPGQLEIVREIVDGDIPNVEEDIAVYTDIRANYTITSNSDGSITVSHTGFDDATPDGGTDDDDAEGDVTNRPMSDGTDRLFNIEVLRFADGDVVLSGPQLDLQALVSEDYAQDFNPASYSASEGSMPWTSMWVESGDTGGSNGGVSAGQIRIQNVDNSNQLVFGDNDNDTGNGGAAIQRVVNLAGVTTATLNYDFDENNFDSGEIVEVSFSANGTDFTILHTINGNSNSGSRSFDLTGPFTANAILKFEVKGTNNNSGNDRVAIDNVSIEFTKVVDDGSTSYETTFTEDQDEVAIANGALIVDEEGEIVSARIVLTNAQAGDEFDIPNNLPGDIDSDVDTSVAGQIIVTLTGAETLANYQNAINAIAFNNTSDAPNTVGRIIQVTVNNGLMDSNVATATVNVVAVDDDVNAGNDSVITNISGTTSIVIPKWALLLNDTDPDSTITITSVINASGLSNLSNGASSISFTDPVTGGNGSDGGGSFSYTATGALGDTDNASVTVTRDVSNNTVDGTTGNNILIGGDTASTFDGGTGNDIILAGGGNDTIVWNANNNGATDGRDVADGGTGTDTFDVNGRNGSETYRVYTREAAVAAGMTGLRNETEIVITRNGTSNTSIIAELDNIEEITIGNLTLDDGTPTGGQTGGDTIEIVGDFTQTSLALNTITIDGNQGDDTIDISSLTSAHRIVFRSNGGNDTIIGTLRPQDVIELPDGASLDDYASTIANGVTTLTSGTNTISFTAPEGSPEIDDEDEETPPPVDEDDEEPAPTTSAIVGTAGADPLFGTSAGEAIMGLSGRDVIFAHGGDDDVLAGDDADMVFGDAGADRLLGEGGDDYINAGSGNDTVFGGSGNDMIVAEAGDGDDTYYGDDMVGGAGNDTLDMSAITANITADLGTGFMGRGSVSSSQTGSDTVWGIENIVTGSGDDVITASGSANVMDGGAGSDTYRFNSAVDANGDTIASFQPGDKIDLSPMDAMCEAGNQSFTLVTGSAFTGAGQVMVTHESREDGDYTVVHGNTDSDATSSEFSISIKGNHELTNTDFNL